MSWKKVGGRNRTQNNYIVRTPQSTIDKGKITEYLGSESSSMQVDSGLNVKNSISIIKESGSQVNPDHRYEPAQLTLWNGTVDNPVDGVGEKIDSMVIYHCDAPDGADNDNDIDINNVSSNIVFNVKPNSGDSFSGGDVDSGGVMNYKALVGINNPNPYFELDVIGNARFDSARIGLGNGQNNGEQNNNEPYDIIGKVIYAGLPDNGIDTFPQYQPLLNYRGAGIINITGYVYVKGMDKTYPMNISLESHKEFGDKYNISGDGTELFNYINISVYNGAPEDENGYYYVEFKAMDTIITKLNFNCPYMFYLDDIGDKLFYEYPTSLNDVYNNTSGDVLITQTYATIVLYYYETATIADTYTVSTIMKSDHPDDTNNEFIELCKNILIENPTTMIAFVLIYTDTTLKLIDQAVFKSSVSGATPTSSVIYQIYTIDETAVKEISTEIDSDPIPYVPEPEPAPEPEYPDRTYDLITLTRKGDVGDYGGGSNLGQGISAVSTDGTIVIMEASHTLTEPKDVGTFYEYQLIANTWTFHQSWDASGSASIQSGQKRSCISDNGLIFMAFSMFSANNEKNGTVQIYTRNNIQDVLVYQMEKSFAEGSAMNYGCAMSNNGNLFVVYDGNFQVYNYNGSNITTVGDPIQSNTITGMTNDSLNENYYVSCHNKNQNGCIITKINNGTLSTIGTMTGNQVSSIVVNSDNMPVVAVGTTIYTYTGTGTDWSEIDGPESTTSIRDIGDGGNIAILTNSKYYVMTNGVWILKYSNIESRVMSRNGRTVATGDPKANDNYGQCIINTMFS